MLYLDKILGLPIHTHNSYNKGGSDHCLIEETGERVNAFWAKDHSLGQEGASTSGEVASACRISNAEVRWSNSNHKAGSSSYICSTVGMP